MKRMNGLVAVLMALTAGYGVTQTTKVGTFDRPSIVVAYYRSPMWAAKLKDALAEREKAKASGDQKREDELSKWGQDQQELAHKQLSGEAPINSILDSMKPMLAAVEAKTHVVRIVPDVPWDDSRVSTVSVDVTDLLLDQLQADTQTRQIVDELRKSQKETPTAKVGALPQRQTLDQPREINGVACARGVAWFYPDGRLQQCTSSREIAVGEAQVQRGSIIVLLPDGRPNYVMMLHDAAVGEVECSGGNLLLGPSEGAMTALYPSGKLKQCWLAKNQVVQGIPCMRGGVLGLFGDGARRDGGAKFYESGKLESCTLAKDYGGKKQGDHFQQTQ